MMPNEYSTFGVQPSDIGRYLPRIAFSTDTQPTLSDAQEIINDHAADLCGFLIGMGVNIPTLAADSGATMYRNCQKYILLRFAAQVMRGRQQNSFTAADEWDREAKELWDRLRVHVQDMAKTRPNGLFSPNILRSNANYQQELTNRQLNSGSRLATNAAVDKM
jgi:hypothetical protein